MTKSKFTNCRTMRTKKEWMKRKAMKKSMVMNRKMRRLTHPLSWRWKFSTKRKRKSVSWDKNKTRSRNSYWELNLSMNNIRTINNSEKISKLIAISNSKNLTMNQKCTNTSLKKRRKSMSITTPKDLRKIWNKFTKPERPLSSKSKIKLGKEDKPESKEDKIVIKTRRISWSPVDSETTSNPWKSSKSSNKRRKSKLKLITKSNSTILWPNLTMTTTISQKTNHNPGNLLEIKRSILMKSLMESCRTMTPMSFQSRCLKWKDVENNSRKMNKRRKRN